MANGRPFNMNALTVANKSLPFGTCVLFTNPKNGKRVVVTVTDRGPFVKGRLFDLSRAAASELGIIGKGTAKLNYEITECQTYPSK